MIPSPARLLMGELARLRSGGLKPNLDLVAQLQGRINELESLVDRLQGQASAGRPAKRRSPARWRFRVVRWEERELTFWPRADAAPKTVPTLRVYVPPEDQHEGAPYLDITRKRVAAVLRPVLDRVAGTGTYITVVQDGDGPTMQLSVRLDPP